MEDLSTSLLIKALDGLSARSAATAHNIANAGAPGYRPVRVSFEQALRSAAAHGPEAVRQVRPHLAQDPLAEMRLDLELADAASTASRYSALVEVLNRQLQLQSLAVGGGR